MNQPRRINKKHFILFNNNGVISSTTPKDWARANQEHFNNYDFTNSKNTPTVNVIEKFLVENLNYHKMENNEMVICYAYYKL
ncbi:MULTISPECIES: hypothetical protein [unclassified Flavobacterium]|uniref:hypothetical protein n=1 Tax=unclassified Flavobacterium TaxID=196869 RepID=UPI0009681C77|nr:MULTISPECIES: hypothetical protein [unclassified Flavobacterium]MBN9285567.1 hypothetical protein [Flavobacterium sp.]OJV71075.1 MAG: hypothetical protein BGO42_04470 [Flavobacterium sp. 40-81]